MKIITKRFEYYDDGSENRLIFDDSTFEDYQGFYIKVQSQNGKEMHVLLSDKKVLKSIISNLQYIHDNWGDPRTAFDEELDNYHNIAK